MGFEVNPNDASRQYLGLLFGNRIGPITLGGTFNPVLSDLFEKFNTIILLLAIGVITYTAIASTINTSDEGAPMSKKYGSAWLPIRAVAGVLLMFPTPGSGFSAIQVFVMWVVLQGVGAANQVWDTVIDGLSAGFSVVGGIRLSDVAQTNLTQRANFLIPDIVNTITCIESLKAIAQNTEDNPEPSAFLDDFVAKLSFYPAAFSEPGTNIGSFEGIGEERSLTKKGYQYAGAKSVPRNKPKVHKYLCGRFVVEPVAEKDNTAPNEPLDDDALEEEIEKRYLHMLLSLNTLYNSYRNFVVVNIVNKNRKRPVNQKKSELIIISNAAVEEYINIMSALASPPDTSSADQGKLEEAKKIGWIHAGNLYYEFGERAAELEITNDLVSMPQIDTTKTYPLTTYLNDVEKEFLEEKIALAKLYTKDLKTKSPVRGTEKLTTDLPKDFAEQIAQFISGFPTPARFTRFIDEFKSGKEPLALIREFGDSLMTSAEATWGTLMIVSTLGIGLSGIAPDISPGAYMAKFVFTIITGIFSAAIIMMWSLGALLAIYIPMVPFLMFTIASIGWMVAVIEGMIAGPIIALGLISASSQGSEEFGKALPGLYILANIFIRPALMIFGFILATLLLIFSLSHLR